MEEHTQVTAKPKMNKLAMTIMAVPVDSVFCGSSRSSEKWPVRVLSVDVMAWDYGSEHPPTEAKMKNIMLIHTEPTMRDLRRP